MYICEVSVTAACCYQGKTMSQINSDWPFKGLRKICYHWLQNKTDTAKFQEKERELLSFEVVLIIAGKGETA